MDDLDAVDIDGLFGENVDEEDFLKGFDDIDVLEPPDALGPDDNIFGDLSDMGYGISASKSKSPGSVAKANAVAIPHAQGGRDQYGNLPQMQLPMIDQFNPMAGMGMDMEMGSNNINPNETSRKKKKYSSAGGDSKHPGTKKKRPRKDSTNTKTAKRRTKKDSAAGANATNDDYRPSSGRSKKQRIDKQKRPSIGAVSNMPHNPNAMYPQHPQSQSQLQQHHPQHPGMLGVGVGVGNHKKTTNRGRGLPLNNNNNLKRRKSGDTQAPYMHNSKAAGIGTRPGSGTGIGVLPTVNTGAISKGRPKDTKGRKGHSNSTKLKRNLPSTTEDDHFHPFSNAPINESEPFNTMYPNLYKIFSSSSSVEQSLKSNGNSNTLMDVVFQFVGTRIEISEAQLDPARLQDSNYVNSLKKKDVHIGIDEKSIGLSKKILHEMNRMHVVAELKGLLAKVNQQSTFLTKQMCQLNSWSQQHYGKRNTSTGVSSAEARAKFAHSTSQLALKVGVSQEVVTDVLNAKGPHPLMYKVKIKCIHFKKPHNKLLEALVVPGSTFATVPIISNALINCGVPMLKQPKKVQQEAPRPQRPPSNVKIERLRTNDRINVSEGRPSTSKSVSSKTSSKTNRKRSYESMHHSERRKIIKKILSERAYAFEQSLLKSDSSRRNEANKRLGKINRIIERHKDRVMTSEEFWEMANISRHWENKSKKEIAAEVSPLWQPELPKREIYWTEHPTPEVVKSKNGANLKDGPKTGSLFSRLQSLLVEEGPDDDTNSEIGSDNDNDNSSEEGDEEILVTGTTAVNGEDSDLVDLSELTLDQRAYIHLRSVHLIDQPLLPSTVPSVVEKDESDIPPFVNNSIDSHIRKMQMEMSGAHKVNNAKLSLLKRLATDETSLARRREEVDATILSKYNLLMKSKHDKVNFNQKKIAAIDTDEWVPT